MSKRPEPRWPAARRDWTPEEVARYELALYRGLAVDKKAQRVFMQKVRIVENVRANKQHQVVTQIADSNNTQDKTPTRAGGRQSGSPGQPLAAARVPRARQHKSKAQQIKSVEKLQHKWLQRRCEAAAAKAGGSSPNVLARVLACCGRFFELLHPDGAARMERLRQAEAEALKAKLEVDASDAGLGAMRAAIAATEEAALKRLIAKDEVADGVRLPPLGGQSSPLLVAKGGGKKGIDIVRRGLCPGDAKWHGAGGCGWYTPDEMSDEPENWPALELSRGRARVGP